MKPAPSVYVVGVALGVLWCGAIVVSTIWLPSMWDKNNQWLIRLLFFTAGLFFVLISTNWRFRNHARLWVSLGILGIVDALFVVGFISQVRRLTVRHYMVILFVETFAGLLVLSRVLRDVDDDIN